LRKPDSQGRKVLDMKEFEEFCQKNPRLIRRLHDQLKVSTPEQVVQFLVDNARVPSLFDETSDGRWEKKKERTRRFPFLPPPQAFDPNELTYDSNLGDDFDAFAAARAWYSYAQEPLPPPDKEVPGHQTVTDRSKQRLPRNITACIFRGYPARGQ